MSDDYLLFRDLVIIDEKGVHSENKTKGKIDR